MFLLESVVHGYHVYKEIWTSILGEELQCIHEVRNIYDLCPPLLRKMAHSTSSSLNNFYSIRSIGCTIAGVPQYSIDQPQGGLEIPCKLMVRGDRKLVDKLKQQLRNVPSLSPVSFRQVPIGNHGETPSTKPKPSIKLTEESIVVAEVDADSQKDVWVSANKNTLLRTDKEVLLMHGSSLTDKHINYAQALLKQQFTHVGELQSTLLQYKSLQNIS